MHKQLLVAIDESKNDKINNKNKIECRTISPEEDPHDIGGQQDEARVCREPLAAGGLADDEVLRYEWHNAPKDDCTFSNKRHQI